MAGTESHPSPAPALVPAPTKAAGKRAVPDSDAEVGEPTPRKPPVIQRKSVHLAQMRQNSWIAYAPDELTPDDIESTQSWLFAAGDFRYLDLVQVVQSRMLYHCVVIEAGPGITRLKIDRAIELPQRIAGMARDVPAGFRIVQNGPDAHSPYAVLRTKGGRERDMYPYDRFDTYEAALRHLLDSSSIKA